MGMLPRAQSPSHYGTQLWGGSFVSPDAPAEACAAV
jgi:hypothetical protein